MHWKALKKGSLNPYFSVRNHPESRWVLGGWVHPAQNFTGCWVAGCTHPAPRSTLGTQLGGFFEHWIQLWEKRKGQIVIKNAKNAHRVPYKELFPKKVIFPYVLTNFYHCFLQNWLEKLWPTDRTNHRPDQTIKNIFFGIPTRPDIQNRWSMPTPDLILKTIFLC